MVRRPRPRARDPLAPTSVAETLDIVVGLARRTFGADGAGILLAADGGAASTAASGAQARRADALQVDHHQGPGFHAINRAAAGDLTRAPVRQPVAILGSASR